MARLGTFDLNAFSAALASPANTTNGVDFTGKSLKLDSAADAKPIVDAINACPELHHLTLTGNTLGVDAAHAIAKALEKHPELKLARWSDMFTGRMKTEIPPALSALGDGMIAAGARLTMLDLSDNAFGPIGVEGLAKLLKSEVCSELQELRLNNNGLGIGGARLLSAALSGAKPPRLRVFVAGRNRLENEGAKALSEVFKKMGSLEEIAMPQNGIYHVGVTALSEALKHNPGLRCLNLNDNTVGGKGAAAIVGALPKLKNLKSINFGDCLLKSKGVLALAKGFKDNSILLESLDLSHNEIGRDACLELVNSITSSADSTKRLQKVILAGNSLGGASNKQSMRQKLGQCAELSDGEGSDEEYVTGSEEESDAESEPGSDEENSQQLDDSAAEVAVDVRSLDRSGLEEVETDVGKFLDNPSAVNFAALGANAVDVIDAHLQIIKDPSSLIEAYVSATQSIAGLARESEAARTAAPRMYEICIVRAGQQHAAHWLLANHMLAACGLIKAENFKIKWNLPSCYAVLNSVVQEPYFPASLRDTLRFFIQAKTQALASLDVNVQDFPALSNN